MGTTGPRLADQTVGKRRVTNAASPTSASHVRITTRQGTLMLGLIISLIVIGLIAGALARLIVPGKQDISIPMTIAIGIIGSFVGGLLGYLIFHHDSQNGFFQPSGIIGSVIGAVIVLLIWVRVGGRSTIRH
jgi:uncharacterized membrane protein YeaQ/YmgE (transglycosylase-associated protein family)